MNIQYKFIADVKYFAIFNMMTFSVFWKIKVSGKFSFWIDGIRQWAKNLEAFFYKNVLKCTKINTKKFKKINFLKIYGTILMVN